MRLARLAGIAIGVAAVVAYLTQGLSKARGKMQRGGMIAVDLGVDTRVDTDQRPLLLAKLRLAGPDMVSVRSVCLAWNQGQDGCCAHVRNVTTHASVLSPERSEVVYVFDRCAPAEMEKAKDLSLGIYSAADPNQPMYVLTRREMEPAFTEWLLALDAHYVAHPGWDRSNPEPEVRITRAA